MKRIKHEFRGPVARQVIDPHVRLGAIGDRRLDPIAVREKRGFNQSVSAACRGFVTPEVGPDNLLFVSAEYDAGAKMIELKREGNGVKATELWGTKLYIRDRTSLMAVELRLAEP